MQLNTYYILVQLIDTKCSKIKNRSAEDRWVGSSVIRSIGGAKDQKIDDLDTALILEHIARGMQIWTANTTRRSLKNIKWARYPWELALLSLPPWIVIRYYGQKLKDMSGLRQGPGRSPGPRPVQFSFYFLCDLIKCQFEYLNKQCTTVHIIIFLFEGRPQCKP